MAEPLEKKTGLTGKVSKLRIGTKRRLSDEALDERPAKVQAKEGGPRTATMPTDPEARPELTIHPFQSLDGLLIKIAPPKEPAQLKTAHVPCDIVLVLDVSRSVGFLAPAMETDEEGNGRHENTDCTVLDIVKHAALTILHTLDENDRLGLVTFSAKARVVHQLLPMTKENKIQTNRIIRGLRTEAGINLWAGLQRGLQLFHGNSDSGKVPALMLLTDCEPNKGTPREGYAKALRARGSLPTSIYTFGFGEGIRSGLLSAIADVGTGYYGFIPNSSVLCTVMVNAVVHLQSTFATKCCLDLEVVQGVRLEISTGQSLAMTRRKHGNGVTLSIPLGNIQYGQSRDICLSFHKPGASKDSVIHARLTYSNGAGVRSIVTTQVPTARVYTLLDNGMAYHRKRDLVCRLIVCLLPRDSEGYFSDLSKMDRDKRISLYETFVKATTTKSLQDRYNQSLNEDIEGRIRLAVYADSREWNIWCRHYLPGFWAAHAKQLRTTSLDSGVQPYDAENPLFLKCQARLTSAFKYEVVPPQPSRAAEADPEYVSGSKTLSMQSYSGETLRRSSNPWSSIRKPRFPPY
ncbi:hypothetical protein PG994_002539 [Apiospora phragmitis]|uniref:VWFA domain-containing protein n=1 Tax=Apiospora phragmitis TaxID=2905665 RepID=A0ABR1W5M7_9PEZI